MILFLVIYMRIIHLSFIAISCLMINSCQYSFFAQCVTSLPNDSDSFGNSLATSDNYLAVGDYKANRVVIYNRNKHGKWLRTQEIEPPKDSIAYKVGFGFGFDVALDQSILVIGSLTWQESKESNEQKNRIYLDPPRSYSGAIYKTRLDKEIELEPINLSIAEDPERLSIIIDEGNIAFSAASEIKSGKLFGRVGVLYNDKVQYFISPVDIDDPSLFGISFALANNLLLIGTPSHKTAGGAWLFDLNLPEAKPQRLDASNGLSGNTVAISEQFAVVGEFFRGMVSGSSYSSSKALVKKINDDSITFIEGFGELSLDGNILAQMRYGRRGVIETSLIEWIRNKGKVVSEINRLKVFRIDENATPRLIKKRSNIDRALVQNSLLITVKRNVSNKKICIEPVH